MISVVFSTRVDNPPHIEHIKKTSGTWDKGYRGYSIY